MFNKFIVIVFAAAICLVTSAQAANIIIVSGNDANDASLKSFLQSNGHTVDLTADKWTDLDETKVAALDAADLIVVSPTTRSRSMKTPLAAVFLEEIDNGVEVILPVIDFIFAEK